MPLILLGKWEEIINKNRILCIGLSATPERARAYYAALVSASNTGKLEAGYRLAEDIYFTKQLGDIVSSRTTNVHKAGMIKFSADTIDEAKRLVHFIQTHLQIEDQNGDSMLFDEFDTSRMDYCE